MMPIFNNQYVPYALIRHPCGKVSIEIAAWDA